MENIKKKLILETGEVFEGFSFGANIDTVCELVFNTTMAGYQEIISDRSYTDQAVVMTYPLIGNYGITDEDFESRSPMLGGLIVREYNDSPSNYRYTKTLHEILEESKIPGISGIDTRKLTRLIRDKGSCKVMIAAEDRDTKEAINFLKGYDMPRDQVRRATSRKKWYSRTTNPLYNVVAIDCGIKLNIIRHLNKKGCNVTIVPFDTTAEEILKLNPDGLFISNGPGDPEDMVEVIDTIKNLAGKLPMFGICLGHQMISLAFGAKTYKMKFGHRGGNHPVKNLATGKIEITSQNHSYAVVQDSIKGTDLELTHINLLDDTAEGVEIKDKQIFSVQYHPESAPGPQDSVYLFDKFIKMMEEKNA